MMHWIFVPTCSCLCVRNMYQAPSEDPCGGIRGDPCQASWGIVAAILLSHTDNEIPMKLRAQEQELQLYFKELLARAVWASSEHCRGNYI